MHRLSDLEQTTILLTTHDLDEAEKLADRDPDPRRRPDRGRRQRGEPGSAVSREMPRSGGPGTASASCTRPPTPRPSRVSCSPQYGDEVEDLEIRRASLEDAYMALVQQHEAGAVDAAAQLFSEVTG